MAEPFPFIPMQPPPVIDPAAESVRKLHLNHEASLQSVGALYLLGCVLLSFAALATLVADDSKSLGERITFFGFCAAFAGLQGWTGLKMRKLNPAARTPATVISGIGLLGFPLGTLISAYILWLLHSTKGKYVFTPEYAAIQAATPHIKYKTSIVVWILFGLVVLMLVTALFAVFAGKR